MSLKQYNQNTHMYKVVAKESFEFITENTVYEMLLYADRK